MHMHACIIICTIILLIKMELVHFSLTSIVFLAIAVAGYEDHHSEFVLRSHEGNAPSEILETTFGNSSRIRGVSDRMEKDFVLGGLFPIHATAASSGGGKCGEVRVEGGVEEMEAMLFALDHVNSDPNLLQNLTLGYDIRDTCYSENIGLDEALDMIISGTGRDLTKCGNEDQVTSGISSTRPIPVFGIIGATASGVSAQVAGLGRLFEVPQVSYASSSVLLNNRDRYTFFYRIVSPDDLQAKAMVSLLLLFDWSHTSVVYSKNAYGTPGRDDVVRLAKEHGICIDIDEGIDNNFQPKDYDDLAEKIDKSTARVVIAFVTSGDARALLTRMVTLPSFSELAWIASDDWSEAGSILGLFNGRQTGGMFGIIPTADHVEEIHSYLTQLSIDSNQRNPWFAEYYIAKIGCNINNTTCSTNSSVSESSHRNFIPRVFDAVYSFVHALQNYLEENCDQPLIWNSFDMSCTGQKRPLNGIVLLEYLANVSFMSPSGRDVMFNELGNIVNASYEIVNYQNGTDGSRIAYIGEWRESSLAADNSSLGKLLFYDGSVQFFGSKNSPTISRCGQCKPGYYHKPVISSCCGICEPCLGQAYSDQNQAPSCKNCSDFGELWGNNPLQGSNGCVLIVETFLDFSDPYSIFITISASLGLLLMLFVATVFAHYWNTPIVKSSSREQMVLLLIGITFSFILAFVYVAPPVLGICMAQRIGLWFCYSLMFGATTIKTLRITRTFWNKSKMKSLKCMGAQYHILFTLLIVIGQMVLIVGSIATRLPSPIRKIRLNSINHYDFPATVIACNGDSISFLFLSVGYESILIAIMTVLGVLSFKFPDNFNEARHVTFCTFTLLIIWIGFVPSFITTQLLEEYQSAVISMATVLSGLTLLIGLFFSRLHIILFDSKKNSNFYSRTTQGELRSSPIHEITMIQNCSNVKETCEGSVDSDISTAETHV